MGTVLDGTLEGCIEGCPVGWLVGAVGLNVGDAWTHTYAHKHPDTYTHKWAKRYL